MRAFADAERLLWTLGLVCIGYCLLVGAEARAYRSFAQQIDRQQTGSVDPAIAM